jgi:hypothetical protein
MKILFGVLNSVLKQVLTKHQRNFTSEGIVLPLEMVRAYV